MCIIHKWKIIKDTGKHHYKECQKCSKRKISTVINYGYQPKNLSWLTKNNE
ncbi:hypothetical protein ICK_06232 [Bacillus cereus BAG1X2-2]|nr:hypothetical protein ICK_06232 [Bacillus cereus BAG1X2-2]